MSSLWPNSFDVRVRSTNWISSCRKFNPLQLLFRKVSATIPLRRENAPKCKENAQRVEISPYFSLIASFFERGWWPVWYHFVGNLKLHNFCLSAPIHNPETLTKNRSYRVHKGGGTSWLFVSRWFSVLFPELNYYHAIRDRTIPVLKLRLPSSRIFFFIPCLLGPDQHS